MKYRVGVLIKSKRVDMKGSMIIEDVKDERDARIQVLDILDHLIAHAHVRTGQTNGHVTSNITSVRKVQ